VVHVLMAFRVNVQQAILSLKKRTLSDQARLRCLVQVLTERKKAKKMSELRRVDRAKYEQEKKKNVELQKDNDEYVECFNRVINVVLCVLILMDVFSYYRQTPCVE